MKKTKLTVFAALTAVALLAAFALVAAPETVAAPPSCEERCSGGQSVPTFCTLECRILLGPGGEQTPEFLQCFNECTIRTQACLEGCERSGN